MAAVTIKDVARDAGVSFKTVSRVVNGEPYVSPKLREKIERSIEKLGFQRNPAARSMGSGRSFSIVMLFDNPSQAYVMEAIRGAYETCRRLGYQLVFENLHDSADLKKAIRDILGRKPDGIIVTPPLTEREAILSALKGAATRVVLLQRLAPVPRTSPFATVGMDDVAATGELARFLWDLGHRRFGLVNGPVDYGVSALRRSSFLETLHVLGVADILESDGEFTFASGVEAGLQLLRDPKRRTAIFAANDDMAAGVYTAANQLGLAIPDHLSVVGFDDSWIAQSVWPALTTIYQPIAEMANAAVELLTQPISSDGTDVLIAHRLTVRESTVGPHLREGDGGDASSDLKSTM